MIFETGVVFAGCLVTGVRDGEAVKSSLTSVIHGIFGIGNNFCKDLISSGKWCSASSEFYS